MKPALLRRRQAPFVLPRTLRVAALPDPANHAGEKRVLVGSTERSVFSDGTNWIDIATGTAIDPWWLPSDAVLHVDFENSRFYWDGAVRSLGDLTAEGVGGYSLSGYGFGYAGDAFVNIEYQSGVNGSDLANFTGNLFSWCRGTSDRVEFDVSTNASYGNGTRLYVSPGNPTADNQPLSFQSITAEGGAVYVRSERRSISVRIANNENHQYLTGNGDFRSGTKGAGALGVPTKIGFGMRARFGDQPLTNGALHKVTIYNTDLTAPHIAAIGKSGETRPVHFLGDSFLNLYGPATYFMELCNDAGKNVPFSQDGVGGTTLTQQAARYAAYAGTQREKWWDSTLVICDFGFEEPELGIDAIKTMLSYIRHDRWIYMQPAPSSALDPVTSLPETHATMKAWMGEDHFVSTLAEAWAESDASPEDEAQIALGRWPVSLTLSDVDFHPNFAGQQFIAQRVYDALTARGWI